MKFMKKEHDFVDVIKYFELKFQVEQVKFQHTFIWFNFRYKKKTIFGWHLICS